MRVPTVRTESDFCFFKFSSQPKSKDPRSLGTDQMEFCPTCGNMLRYELPHLERSARFFCATCRYVCQIESKVKIKRHLRLVKKSIDPIFTEEDFKDSNITTSVKCPECNHEEISYRQIQTRSCIVVKAHWPNLFAMSKSRRPWSVETCI